MNLMYSYYTVSSVSGYGGIMVNLLWKLLMFVLSMPPVLEQKFWSLLFYPVLDPLR